MLILKKIRVHVATVFCLLFFYITAEGQNYTMSVPVDIDPDWGLCMFEIVSYGNHNVAAVALATMEEEFEGVKTLSAGGWDFIVTWHPALGGGGEITVETDYKNQYWIELGFCHWTEDHSDRSYKKIIGDLIGGSVNEEDLEGPYSGYLAIVFDLCGKDDDYSESERLRSVIEEALPQGSNAQVVFRGFETSQFPQQTQILYDLVNYEPSHRPIGEHILENAFGPEHAVHVTYLNRGLYVGDCNTAGLWYQVVDTEDVNGWSESYTGLRVVAIPKNEGNVMITYGAALNTAMVNVFASNYEPAMLTIGSVPEFGSPDYFLSTFVIITKAEGMDMTDMIRSNSGILTLTKGMEPNNMSGHFEIVGIDLLGRTRSVIGGFRNLTFSK